MSCQKCSSNRIAFFSTKCSDRCYVSLGDKTHDGYAPDDMGVGGGDYLEIDICLDCGQAQGEFPLPKCELEEKEDE
jgi:hypothetical protein